MASSALKWLGVAVVFWAYPHAASPQSSREVTVVGLDYAFQAPSTLPGGLTAIAFENHGKVRHEVVVARLKPGVTLDSLLHAETGLARLRFVQNVGILLAEAGEKALGRLLVELVPGSYVLYCNFQDAPDKPRHLTMGMIASIEIKQ